ncbi:MAG: adenylosuccinate synthase [Chloroflexota bacterium]
MTTIAAIGGQWGDEGKGKVVDLLAEKAKFVARFSGGDNAGHTVINPCGEFRLHLVPSGIFYPQVTSLICNGVVVNPAVLLKELAELKERGVDTSRLVISRRAHLIMPYHTLLDGLEEDRRGGNALGTTRKGIGPAYADKTARLGIRIGDLADRDAFRTRLQHVLAGKNAILEKVYQVPALSLQQVHDEYCGYAASLAPLIGDTESIIQDAARRGEPVLLEGAQGSLLDPDFGTYPYVTSSSPLAGNSCLGSGLNPRQLGYILGVFKAYITRVGSGPMPTELQDATGELIRETAHEYGATTGRPRRCGWFDAVAARLTVRINGFDGIALTRLDVLDSFPSINVCVAYRIGGRTVDQFPDTAAVLQQCEPVYQEFPGWQTPTSDVTSFEKLPRQARDYITALEELIGCQATLVSVGARRHQSIWKGKIPW